MKFLKIFIFIYLCLIPLVNCISQTKDSNNKPLLQLEKRIKLDISRYEIFTVLPEQYRFAENYGTLKEKGYEIKFGIIRKPLHEKGTLGTLTEEKEYIREIVYFLEKEGEIIPLGRFSSESGFLDAFGEKDLYIRQNFIKEHFFGFPIDTIRIPF